MVFLGGHGVQEVETVPLRPIIIQGVLFIKVLTQVFTIVSDQISGFTIAEILQTVVQLELFDKVFQGLE
jgi:hypothetical protein